MGYYSKVSILCGRNVAERLVKLPDLFGCKIHKRGDGLFRFVWESVKWYEGDFDEVDAVKAVVNEWLDRAFPPDGPDKPDFCSFIRIGEDDEDTEYESNSLYWERQYIHKDVGVSQDEPVPVPSENGMCELSANDARRMMADLIW